MTFMDKLKAVFAGSAERGGDPSNRLFIIDTSQLTGSNGGRESRSPRDQFKLLQRLARFVNREKIRVIAVLDGRPLNESAEGAEYNGVRTHYAPTTTEIPGRVFGLLNQHQGRFEVIVITADRDLERRASQAGASVMRISTLRKAMDNGGGGEGGEGSRSSRRGRRPHRRKPDRSPAPNREPSGESKGDSGPASGVQDLIDLVD